ncbi:rho gtpase-activating protein 68f [Anaeramoeba flamelloides]|uniref:Rho gtpase-activating protein 68f n=1 Tax=Anaeramoeba flamelloides TaxID=1746091 RepID=A0ABQ8XPI7_9EUKA|nr:rho gtpase-activating protein 68f [Anaeramoeba flamelloides]
MSKKLFKTSPKNTNQQTKIFGSPIIENGTVPPIIIKIITQLENMEAENHEGLFRIPGRAKVIQDLKESFNSGEETDLSEVTDINSLAGLLKLYFRDLPQTLLTFDLYDCFIAVHSITYPEERLKRIKSIIWSLLTTTRRKILQVLIKFLRRISQNSENNLMSSTNLGIIFGPALLRSKRSDFLQLMMTETPEITGIISTMIDYYHEVFEIPFDPKKKIILTNQNENENENEKEKEKENEKENENENEEEEKEKVNRGGGEEKEEKETENKQNNLNSNKIKLNTKQRQSIKEQMLNFKTETKDGKIIFVRRDHHNLPPNPINLINN